MSSLKDAAEARREKRRFQQVIREAHNKDNNAIAHYKQLQEQERSYSKEPDPGDLVKGKLVETKTSPRVFNQKVAPLMQLSQETKSGEFDDDVEKQKLLRPGTKDDDESENGDEDIKVSKVSLYISENLFTFVDFFQQLGLLWAISFLVDWPPQFLLSTCWFLGFNIDISMMYFYYNQSIFKSDNTAGKADPHFSDWGELREGYLLYAFIWSLVGMLMIGLVAWMWTHDWFCGTLRHEKTHDIAKNRLRHSLFWISYVIGVPIVLALLRPFVCEPPTAPGAGTEYVMAFDTSQKCLTAVHIFAVVMFGLIAGTFVVGLYFSFAHMVHPHTVYKQSENHERYIQQKESEYLLGINKDYIVFHYAFFFSFRRPFVHFRLYRFTEKILLILAYLFLQQRMIQTTVFWLVTMVFGIFYTIARPFRAPASNIVLLICQYTVCLNTLLLAAKGTKFEAAAFLNSQLSVMLWVLNAIGFVLALAVFVGAGIISGCNPLVIDPINQPRVNRGEDVRRWVKVIKDCNDYIRVNAIRPYEFLIVTPLENQLRVLAQCFHEAELADHVLQFTLLDVAQEAEYFLEQVREKNLLPNTTLEEALVGARPLLDRVDETMAMVQPKRKRFLRKLLALRLFRIGYHGPQSDSDEEDVSQIEMNETIDVDELVDATHRALIPPMDKDVLFDLKSKWRACIQRWKANFVRTKGRQPTVDDMWVISTERKNYAMVSSAYQQHSSRRK